MAKKDTATNEAKKTTKKSEKIDRESCLNRFYAKEIREKTSSLCSTISKLFADLADARRSLAAGELVNPNVISKYKKTIARIQIG